MTRLLLSILSAAVLGCTTNAFSATIGDPVVPASDFDGGTGQLFIWLGSFPDVGDNVVSWSFYSDANASNDCSTGQAAYVCYPGATITPVLFYQPVAGGNYVVQAIGTTRANNLDGVQTYAFDAVSGSATILPTTTFGFKSGLPTSNSDTDFGVVDFSNGTNGAGFVYEGERAQLTQGASFANGSPAGRLYSISFTSTPEPSSLLLILTASCATALPLYLRRRVKDAKPSSSVSNGRV